MSTTSDIGGKLGKAIDLYGKYGKYVPIPAISAPSIIMGAIGDQNISESLESWGGAGGTFKLVPQAQAYEPVSAPVDTTVDNRNPFLEQGLLDPLNINTTSNNNSSGSTQQTKQPTTTNNFDPMNRNIDPGPGYFWDAADGWKPVGGGSSYDAERARREQEARDNINSGFGQHVNNLNNLIPHYRLARLTLSAVKSCYNKRSQLLRVCQREL